LKRVRSPGGMEKPEEEAEMEKEELNKIISSLKEDIISSLKKEIIPSLKKEIVSSLRTEIEELQSQIRKLEISFYAVEEGIVNGRRTERKLREFRETLISDPRGFNSLRKLLSRHY